MSTANHRFFTMVSLAACALIVAGFGSTYGGRVLSGASVPTVIHLHAAVFGTWIAVFIAQSLLVAVGRVAVHRRLGVAGAFLAVLMLVLGVAAAVSAGRQGHRGIPGGEFPTPAGFVLFSVLAVLSFFALTAMALWFRSDPQVHKRLMLLALVGPLLPPGLTRVPWLRSHLEVTSAVWLLFVIAGPCFDLVTRRTIHKAWWWGAPCVAVTFPPLSTWLAATRPGLALSELLLG